MALRYTHELARLREQLRYEPALRRLRVSYAGQPIADTSEALLVWEPRAVVPWYAVPVSSLLVEHTTTRYTPPDPIDAPPIVIPEESAIHLAPGRSVSLIVGDTTLDSAGYRFDDPDLAGYVLLAWGPFSWEEEARQVVGHPHDPFSRIDVLPSERQVEVRFGGIALANSSRAMLLLETGLPQRWYLPPEDVRQDLLLPSERHSVCAYKGTASYLSLGTDPAGRDLAWFYPEPRHDALPVKDLICFWVERTELLLDGVPVERPDSPFDGV